LGDDKMRIHKNIYPLILFISLLLVSCSEQVKTNTSPHFKINVTKYFWMVRSQVYGYTRESAFPIMKKININKDTLWSITEENIEQYDWTNQEITLTLDATNKILQSLGEDTLFGWVAMKQIFIVTFDNEWRFGRVIEMQGSAAAIRFPVIYLDYYSTNKII
jgi:hypothetical protein